MDYNTIKKNYDSARREQLNVDKQIRKIQTELNSLDEKYHGINTNYDSMIANDKAKALEVYRKKVTEPIEAKLQTAKAKLTETKTYYEDTRKSINFDDLLKQCSSRQEILDEVREASAVLKEHLQEITGEAFFTELCNQMESKEITINEDSLPRIIAYFNKSEDVIERLRSGGFSAEKAIDGIETSVKENKNVSMVLSVLVLVCIIAFTWKTFAIYTLLAGLYGAYNLSRHRKIYKIFMVQKAVQDNIDGIDSLLKKQIEEEVQSQIEELDNEYVPKIENLEEQIKCLEQDVIDSATKANSSFIYDGTKMDNLKRSEIESLDKQKSALLVQKKKQEDLLQEKTKIVGDLAEQLNEMLSGLKKQYLTGVGKDVIFEPHFLFDIDTAKNKPTFFLHPQTSCLFLYESIADVYDFIRLICVQLRAKLNPFNLSITVLDIVNAGNDLLYFTASDGKINVKPLFQIIVSEEDMKERLNTYQLNLMKRQENIVREFGDIQTYNTKMLEMKSLTESYDFLFCIDPSKAICDHSTMIRLMKIGGTLGIFPHLFIAKEEMTLMKDNALTLLDNIGKVYYLEDGVCRERAKDFIRDDLLKAEDE